MQYCRIFQLDPDLPREEREWSFMGWDYAQKVFGHFNQLLGLESQELQQEYEQGGDWAHGEGLVFLFFGI